MTTGHDDDVKLTEFLKLRDNDCLRTMTKPQIFATTFFLILHPKTLKEILPYIGKSSKYALLYGY